MTAFKTAATGIRSLLESPRSHFLLVMLAPVMFALASLATGQDSNFDLLNYHLYNVWALLNGRVGVDLAPAHMQSYFNPLLDIPYYVTMVMYSMPRLTAAAMGLVHGTCFIALLWIGRHFVTTSRSPNTSAVMLAAAGCTSAVFLSELGNTMGDNTTAPLVLASLAVVLHGWSATGTPTRRVLWGMLGAGALAGAAAGLKLTNSVYALAACLAVLLAWPSTMFDRLKVALAFAAGVALGITATSGFWFATLWQIFGNPLFPQFNGFFRAPMAAEVNITDTRWLPRSVSEALAFPFIMSWNPGRVGENGMRQIVLPLLYSLFIVVGLRKLRRRGLSKMDSPRPPAAHAKARFILGFAAISYLLWLALFSIHRYLAVLELVAPIAIWLLLHELPIDAPRAARRILAAAALVAIASWSHWGSVRFAEQVAEVPPPPVTSPRSSVIVMAGSPLAWMIPFFPPGPTYVSLGHSYPESATYAEEAKRRIRAASGHAYVMFETASVRALQTVARVDRSLERWSVSRDGIVCAMLRWVASKSRRFDVDVTPAQGAGRCAVAPGSSMTQEVAGRNAELVKAKQVGLSRAYGIRFESRACTTHTPRWGAREFPYFFCWVSAID